MGGRVYYRGRLQLVLSIALVRHYGIIGDALGTAIPPHLQYRYVCVPRHLCRQLGIRYETYLREAYVLPLIVSAPLVVVCY